MKLCSHCKRPIIANEPWVNSPPNEYHDRCFDIAVSQPAKLRAQLKEKYDKTFFVALSSLLMRDGYDYLDAIKDAHRAALEVITTHDTHSSAVNKAILAAVPSNPPAERPAMRPGDYVLYIPDYADGPEHPDCEHGTISSLQPSGKGAFVKYEQQVKKFGWAGATSKATNFEDLIFDSSKY